ncbi:hypothetical protein F5Y15DRAFT_383879 [Xylariaceae sp. FL0016]|nr:hypothetical protein F5Y15DRAFT_383879 [Xylariaceae sp. FL0016]
MLSPANSSDPGRGPAITAVGWLLTSICIIMISLRFYVRAGITRALSYDDWIMLMAVVLQVTNHACLTVSYEWGLGMHDVDLSFDQTVNLTKWIWISSMPGGLVSILARISIAILLIRVFGSQKWLKWYLVIFTSLSTVVTLAYLINIWLQVSPVEGLWNPMIPARRWDPKIGQDLGYLTQSLFTFSDLTYVLFPVRIIWTLNMPMRRKLGLCTLMALSLITMGISILKATYIKSADLNSADALYNASLTTLWANLEQCLVIIMGCIPPLQPIRNMKLPKGSSSISRFIHISTWTSSRHTPSSSRPTKHSRSTYYDLETVNLARPDTVHRSVGRADRDVQRDGHRPSDEARHDVLDALQIRRTDQFTVTYSDRGSQIDMV